MMEFFHCHEIALLDMMAGIGHEAQIEREVVDAGYLHRQQLLCLEEVVEVGLRGYEVDVAAVGIYRTEVLFSTSCCACSSCPDR